MEPDTSGSIAKLQHFKVVTPDFIPPELVLLCRKDNLNTRNKSNDYFESLQYRRTCLPLPITPRENISLASIHVVQKITIIRAQKIGKLAV